VVGVVLNEKGEVLVVSQHGTAWSLPKGHIEAGEDAISAAKRETLEESGLSDLEFVKTLGEYQRFRIGKDGREDRSEQKTILMFLFKSKSDILKPIDPENPEARWVLKEKVAELLTHPKDKQFFLSIINQI
jgi:8-oxo-dGTP pyrophosphatase MutT (NUDIX family)